MLLTTRSRTIEFPRRPLIMGILNLNDDSFSDAGAPQLEMALAMAEQFIREGADIIDIGAESARTNRGPITEAEEIARFLPFIAAFQERVQQGALPAPRDAAQLHPPLLSLNTWRPGVVREILPAGGDLLNDMGGLPTAENARMAAQHGVALLIMHLEGAPKVPHPGILTPDIVRTVAEFLQEKCDLAVREGGLPPEQILLDPGIGFAKTAAQDLEIMRRLPELAQLQRPLLLPISRKEVIGKVLNLPDARERDSGTIAAAVLCAQGGAHILRVHDVAATYQVLRMLEAIGTASA